MSSKYKVADHTLPHHLTFTVIHWIDVFSREAYRQIILDSLAYCIAQKGLNLHAWVIMPNHMHLVASTKEGHSIPDFVRDFKKFTGRQIIAAIKDNPQESRREWLMRAFTKAGEANNSNNEYQFWQQDYRPIELSSRERLMQRIIYVHRNPVRAGIVWEPQYYKYSSAGDYALGQEGLLPLDIIEAHGVQLW